MGNVRSSFHPTSPESASGLLLYLQKQNWDSYTITILLYKLMNYYLDHLQMQPIWIIED